MTRRHLSEQRRKAIASLSRRKGRLAQQQMLIEGWRSVAAALEAGAPVVELLLTPAMAEDAGVVRMMQADQSAVVYEISEKVARQISAVDTAPGIFAVARIDATNAASLEAMQTIVALDGVQDPGNVGTIIRTAAWFGVDAVLGNADTADFFSPKVVRASMGGIWDTALVREHGFVEALAALKKAGFQLVGADLDGTPLTTWQPTGQTVLIIGGEANGISDHIRSMLDMRITIADNKSGQGTESLNAAIAAGIILHRWMAG